MRWLILVIMVLVPFTSGAGVFNDTTAGGGGDALQRRFCWTGYASTDAPSLVDGFFLLRLDAPILNNNNRALAWTDFDGSARSSFIQSHFLPYQPEGWEIVGFEYLNGSDWGGVDNGGDVTTLQVWTAPADANGVSGATLLTGAALVLDDSTGITDQGASVRTSFTGISIPSTADHMFMQINTTTVGDHTAYQVREVCALATYSAP